jgi:ferrous iron transport protein B
MDECGVATAGTRVESGRVRGSSALVALVGPPNSGKSTLFNQLTGLRQKVANYPGVTVEKRLGHVRLPDGREVGVVDLPGVHGFAARSLDEKIAKDVLEGRAPDMPRPDAVILVIDSTRLEPHLMLVEPVLELGLPTLLVLNMSDELESRGGSVDADALADRLGVEVVRANARGAVGLDRVRAFLARVAAGEVAAPVAAGARGAGAVVAAEASRLSSGAARTARSRRLELPVIETYIDRRGRARLIGQQARYTPPAPAWLTERLDAIFLNRLLGPVIFFVVVALVFQAIFSWAEPLMDGIETLVEVSGAWLGERLPDNWVRSLLIDGVWAGVGSVVVFLPQILILFLFIGILEDSGYMARAAVIADRMMYKVGLQGRAFLPLLSGYACAVPAIMATRTVEDERDRLATIFVVPFMTCSARLPVYTLLIAAFIPNRPLLGPFFGAQAATLLGLYVLGAVAAVGTAFLLKRTLLRGESTTFMMELPPYRLPTLRSLAIRLLDRARIFLRRVGRVILTVSVVLWGLTQFPRVGGEAPEIGESALGRIGQVIEPVIEPLGFDWRIGVGIISSLAAREVIVGTLGTIYGIEEATETSGELRERLQRDLDMGSGIALMVFFAFALQCISTIATVRRETGGWKWPAIQWAYMLTLAVIGAFLANRIF